MRPAVPEYCLLTPTLLLPFLRKPVSSTTSTACSSPRCSTTYSLRSSRTSSASHKALFSSRCMPSGFFSPANSANCQPFLRLTGLSKPFRYASARERCSERAKRGAMRPCNCSNPSAQFSISVTPTIDPQLPPFLGDLLYHFNC